MVGDSVVHHDVRLVLGMSRAEVESLARDVTSRIAAPRGSLAAVAS